MGKYDDLLLMPHPVSASHPPMPAENRAAQFAPFAALSGYEAAVREAGRRTNRRVVLDENAKEIINRKLLFLQECPEEQHTVSVTYFVPDRYKSGGKYETVTSCVKQINVVDRILLMDNGTKIPIWEISAVEGEVFRFLDGEGC